VRGFVKRIMRISRMTANAGTPVWHVGTIDLREPDNRLLRGLAAAFSSIWWCAILRES